MREALKVPGGDPSRIKVVLSGPTGVSAVNIDGNTLHLIFGLPFNQFNGAMPRLSESNRNRLAHEIADVDLIIIDEISMASMDQLFQIDERLRQIKNSTKDFGGLSVLVVGDFSQLEPVMAKPVFSEPTGGRAVLSHNYLWPKFKLYELTECMRQKDDAPFAQALNQLANSDCQDEDIGMFKSREISPNSLKPPNFAVRL